MEIEKYRRNRVNGPGVTSFTPGPLKATVSLLSEGYYPCIRCNSRIDGLAGYLDDAEGRFIGVVHEKCVLPEERDERSEPETPELRAGLQMIEREQARFYGTQFFHDPSRCA